MLRRQLPEPAVDVVDAITSQAANRSRLRYRQSLNTIDAVPSSEPTHTRDHETRSGAIKQIQINAGGAHQHTAVAQNVTFGQYGVPAYLPSKHETTLGESTRPG